METATVEMAARYDLRTIRALRAERKKFKLAKRALRPSLRENKRNNFNLLNILKVYWNFYNCLINRKLVLNTPIVPTATNIAFAWVRRVPSATVSQAVTRQNFNLKAEMFSFHSKYFVHRELKWAPFFGILVPAGYWTTYCTAFFFLPSS